MPDLAERDPEVAQAIRQEDERQRNNIVLIAAENYASKAVLQAQSGVMNNKYAEGYPGRRYYAGCENVDIVERLAIQRAKEIFGAQHVNVQPHSGSQANMAVYFALLEPGDKVLGMQLDHGGHLTHGASVNFSGKLYQFIPLRCRPRDRDHRFRLGRAAGLGTPAQADNRRLQRLSRGPSISPSSAPSPTALAPCT